ncbi:MAG: MBL fold metallo-hydrolase [Candidatus Omnitrophica bacterium]|nr:MBL fold metallo-hydrolase [Candidatus Omnitrophota bacterium]MBU1870437.1 MBL fold metallo-hydrolase [Candidatus Omnitrophota bacterium]
MILETICVGPMQVNCYVLANAKGSKAIIIDPGAEVRKIKQVLDKYGLTPEFVVNTHGHYDHIGSDDKFGVPVYIHKDDVCFLKDANLNLSGLFSVPYQVDAKIIELEDGESIGIEDIKLKVMHIPGHTPGGIALIMQKPSNKIVFTGDALFCQGIGRSDLAGGNAEELIKFIREKLLTLADETVIYPGHGPSSTIGQEKVSNPYL